MEHKIWPGLFKESKLVMKEEKEIIPVYNFSTKKFTNCSSEYIKAQSDILPELKKLKWNELRDWMKQNNADFVLAP